MPALGSRGGGENSRALLSAVCVTEDGGAVTAHWSENSFFVRLLNSALGVQLEAKGETGGGGLEQTLTRARARTHNMRLQLKLYNHRLNDFSTGLQSI